MWERGRESRLFFSLLPSEHRFFFIGCLLGRPCAAWSIRDSGKSYFFSVHKSSPWKSAALSYMENGLQGRSHRTYSKSQRDIPHQAHSYKLLRKNVCLTGANPNLAATSSFNKTFCLTPRALLFGRQWRTCSAVVSQERTAQCNFDVRIYLCRPPAQTGSAAGDGGHNHVWCRHRLTLKNHTK